MEFLLRTTPSADNFIAALITWKKIIFKEYLLDNQAFYTINSNIPGYLEKNAALTIRPISGI